MQAALGHGGVDFKTRTIFLFGHVDGAMAMQFAIAFRTLDSSKGTIRIILNSSGGSEQDGFAMYDMLRLARNQVVIDCYGVVQSIAALILQGAWKRRMSLECRLMMHNGTVETSGPVHQGTFVSVASESAYLTKRYHEVIANRCGVTPTLVGKWSDQERYFSAAEALSSNLIDEIIDSSKKVELPSKRKSSGEMVVEIDEATIEKVLRKRKK